MLSWYDEFAVPARTRSAILVEEEGEVSGDAVGTEADTTRWADELDIPAGPRRRRHIARPVTRSGRRHEVSAVTVAAGRHGPAPKTWTPLLELDILRPTHRTRSRAAR